MTPEPVLGDKQGFIDKSMARTRAKPEAMKFCNELSAYSLASYPKHEIFRLASVLGRIPLRCRTVNSFAGIEIAGVRGTGYLFFPWILEARLADGGTNFSDSR